SLWVQRDGLAVVGQMDGQLGHPQDRIVDSHQMLSNPGTVSYRKAPADAQVAIEPGVQPRSPVWLQRDHLPADDEAVRVLLDPQVRAVGVRADDPKRTSEVC